MNIDANCPHCNRELAIDQQWIGQDVECPYCNKGFTFTGASSPSPQYLIKKAMKEYKVLTQKDKWFSGKFDPERLEGAINAYAKQGWRVIGCATASMPGFMSNNREEIIIIMERG